MSGGFRRLSREEFEALPPEERAKVRVGEIPCPSCERWISDVWTQHVRLTDEKKLVCTCPHCKAEFVMVPGDFNKESPLAKGPR